MPTSNDPRDQVAKAAMKELRARDAALAVKEYEAERLATIAKTARLRALRLAKERKAAQNPPPVATSARPRKRAATARRAPRRGE